MDLINITRQEGLKFQINVRDHNVACDMSTKDGGNDAGPSPVELFAGSLGTCVALMVQSYCNRHGYEGDVEVSLTLELADKPKRVGAVVIDVEVPDSVPEDKRDVIKLMAEKCPVHETLRNPPRVDIDIM